MNTIELSDHLNVMVDVIEQDLISFIEKRYNPEMVFSKQKLEQWAIKHGFVKTTDGA